MAARVGLDELLAAAGIDAGDGVQIVRTSRLASVPFDPGLPLLLLGATANHKADQRLAVLPGRHARSSAREVLIALYPHGQLARPLPEGEPVALDALTDEQLAGRDWLLPAVELLDNLASPHGMAAISARLRAPDGCPWDRKQTHATLTPFLLEEAYEAVDAIDGGSPGPLAEELGDLFLQVVLHAQLSAEEAA